MERWVGEPLSAHANTPKASTTHPHKHFRDFRKCLEPNSDRHRASSGLPAAVLPKSVPLLSKVDFDRNPTEVKEVSRSLAIGTVESTQNSVSFSNRGSSGRWVDFTAIHHGLKSFTFLVTPFELLRVIVLHFGDLNSFREVPRGFRCIFCVCKNQ